MEAKQWTPLSMRIPRQEYCSALPFPSPGDFPNPGIKLKSTALEGSFFTSEPPGKPKKPMGHLRNQGRDFSGGPVVKTPCFQLGGEG